MYANVLKRVLSVYYDRTEYTDNNTQRMCSGPNGQWPILNGTDSLR